MNVKQLEQAVGGLSKPSKMPGFAYGTPAADCKIGSILRAAGKHTVCGSCYAHKGMYGFPVVKAAQKRRLAILLADPNAWADKMVLLLKRKYARKIGAERVFRWHDSGDVQSVDHLEAIFKIANALPDIRFWLPTKEYALVRKFLQENACPQNLVIRVSAPVLGSAAPAIPGTVSSTVEAGIGYACPAPKQGNACEDCRACWDNSVLSVDYHRH